MAPRILLWSLQVLAVSASLNFREALKFHQKRQTPAQALSACSLVLGVLTECEAVSPGFTTMAASRQAPCACYYADATTTAWVPNAFDRAVETCASYARTNDAAVYSGLQPFNRLCNRVGDLRTVAVATPPAACANVVSAVQYCNTANPGLSTMGVSSSAFCLCYDSTTWIPGIFDGAVRTCASYVRTASPSDYSLLVPLQGFCTSVGNFIRPANTPATTTRATPRPTPVVTPNNVDSTPIITTPASRTQSLGGIATFPACSTIGDAILSCESLTPGFTTLPASSQAACVCYTSSTSWVPEVFDGAATTCAEHVRTASPEDYNVFSNLAGFCSDVGDIYAATTVRTTTRSNSAGGGIGAGGIVFGDSTSTSTTVSPTRTVTVNPGAATPNSSRAFAMPTAVAGGWVTRIVSLVVIVQALA